MPRKPKIDRDQAKIADCLAFFEANQKAVQLFLDSVSLYVTSSSILASQIHTIRPRLKSATSLRDKLYRKLGEARENAAAFDITPGNLFERINDLAGLRILHLHRGQIVEIDRGIREIVEEQKLTLIEVFARTWDDKSREFYSSISIPAEVSPTMYTSVHYVLGSASRTVMTCEIQVRTLMEEVWGEIDHSINYPHPIDNVACRAQLETLAHMIRTATANVDGIVKTVAALKEEIKPAAPAAKAPDRSR